MFRPIHLYLFRTINLLSLSLLAALPFVFESTLNHSVFVWPLLMVAVLVGMALLEQKLLHLINWQQAAPIKAHKLLLKPVRLRKHAGCRLLGLPCAA